MKNYKQTGKASPVFYEETVPILLMSIPLKRLQWSFEYWVLDYHENIIKPEFSHPFI
jgi:hypothetical protein